jgi:hypothetical protein
MREQTAVDTNDPVRAYLRETGCGEHVVEGGLTGLVANWERTVQAVADGYKLGLDDYLNDLDARQLLEEALTVATAEQLEDAARRIEQADELMQSVTEPTVVCLWGDEVAREEGWTPQENWWYFARPRQAEDDLLAEIDEVVSAA